jgi:serine/threonine-protein kinase HipA
MINTLKVYLYGMQMGTLLLGSDGFCTFEYTDAFCRTGLQPAPLTMPAVPGNTYRFPALSRGTFNGLPGMIADALPDSFGQALLNRWLAASGRSEGDANVIEKLSFQGKRCMGALEFVPSREAYLEESSPIELDEMIRTAARVLSDKDSFRTSLQEREKAILDILKIGTSAGGQRAKAVIAMNGKTGEIRSGQVAAPEGFDYWLLKFDGFDSNARPVSPANFGRLEYAFAQCVRDAGITITQCRLLEENGRAHFMTRRFDRVNGRKLHLQTLCGLAHLDFRLPGAHSYEQAFMVMRRLGLTYKEGQDMFRRMAFNVMSVNMDDHTKNISFLMTDQGRWLLSPAYDMGFSYNPDGLWANAHQMTVNGKRDGITLEDLLKVAETQDIRNPKELIEQVEYGISRFEDHALGCGVPRSEISAIKKTMGERNPLKHTKVSV